MINLFLSLFDVSLKSHKSFWLTNNIRNLRSVLDALVTNINFKGSRKRCTWVGLIEGEIKDPDSPKWINNDSFWYFPIFKFMFLHNFWLELFIQCIRWLICIRMRVLKFYLFCTSNNFFRMGEKCRKEELLDLFCRNINSSFSGALGLTSFNNVLIDHCLFREKLLEIHWFFCLINHFTASTKNISVRLPLLFAIGLDYSIIYLVFNLTLKQRFCLQILTKKIVCWRPGYA